MERIRPFVEGDIPRIVKLYQSVYRDSKIPSSEVISSFFQNVFFNNPWYDEHLPSLVYQESTGKIIGFLGVFPRRMSMNERQIKVAVSNNFMVEPDHRNTLAALELLETFFQGPQDLSIAEAGDLSRKLWEGLGGQKSLLYSVKWTRTLRPCRYINSILKQMGVSIGSLFLSGPVGRLLDSIAARMPPNHFNRSKPKSLKEEALDVPTFLGCIQEFAGKKLLRPVYDEPSLAWLLDLLAQKKSYGNLRKEVLRNQEKEICGWYVYYVNPGGLGEVLQIGATHDTINEVLDSLFYHAWTQGVVSLSGGIEPQFIQEFSNKYCFFKHGGWLLVHSPDVELINAFNRGDAFFSRLEGEWMFFSIN